MLEPLCEMSLAKRQNLTKEHFKAFFKESEFSRVPLVTCEVVEHQSSATQLTMHLQA